MLVASSVHCGGLTLGTPSAAAPSTFWQGKRVLLAGASSGLGEALAQALSARGASLVLGARRSDRLAAVAAECTAAEVLPLDVTAGVEELVAKSAEAAALLGGGVDVLCYAAGVGQRTMAAETSAAAHETVMATNFEGAVALSRALLPQMVERESGHVIVVSSVQGFFGQPARSSYAASKAALVGYFDSVRAEVAKHGVGVTVVAPGYIATDHSASAIGGGGVVDANSKKGMDPTELALMVLDAVERGQPELIASQVDGRVAMLLRRLWPDAFFKIMQWKGAKT